MALDDLEEAVESSQARSPTQHLGGVLMHDSPSVGGIHTPSALERDQRIADKRELVLRSQQSIMMQQQQTQSMPPTYQHQSAAPRTSTYRVSATGARTTAELIAESAARKPASDSNE